MNLRRRTEDVDYWRKQAGWYDDDISMNEYNQGVYGRYHANDGDDNFQSSSGYSGESANSGTQRVGGSNGFAAFMKIGAIILSLVFLMLLYRAISRRASSSSRKVGSSSKTGTADTKRRTRSRSRSSRSRSRSRRHGTSGTNYELMDEKSEKSKGSRSRSRSRRRSKSKSRRSASKSRSKKDPSKEVLV